MIWQQRAEREDPYPDVPFDDGRKYTSDTLIGMALLVVGIVGLFL